MQRCSCGLGLRDSESNILGLSVGDAFQATDDSNSSFGPSTETRFKCRSNIVDLYKRI